MVALPKVVDESEIIDRIYKTYEEREAQGAFRFARLGASGIAEDCLRAVWYDWRGFLNPVIPGRILRLFETGHQQEDRIVADLQAAGFKVWAVTEEGKQFTYTDETGHFVVKLDGVIRGLPGAEKTPHVLEIKSHNKNSFTELQKKGVEKSKPDHFIQIQAGMLYSGIQRGLYVALCKDNEEYYVERVMPDQKAISVITERVPLMLKARTPPAKAGENRDSFVCRFCDFKDLCWGTAQELMHCRSCEQLVPIDEGQWACEKHGVTRSWDEQVEGCNLWKPIIWK